MKMRVLFLFLLLPFLVQCASYYHFVFDKPPAKFLIKECSYSVVPKYENNESVFLADQLRNYLGINASFKVLGKEKTELLFVGKPLKVKEEAITTKVDSLNKTKINFDNKVTKYIVICGVEKDEHKFTRSEGSYVTTTTGQARREAGLSSSLDVSLTASFVVVDSEGQSLFSVQGSENANLFVLSALIFGTFIKFGNVGAKEAIDKLAYNFVRSYLRID